MEQLPQHQRDSIRQSLYKVIDYSVRMDSKSRGNAHSWAVFSLDHFTLYDEETLAQFLHTLELVEARIYTYEESVKREIDKGITRPETAEGTLSDRAEDWFGEQYPGGN